MHKKNIKNAEVLTRLTGDNMNKTIREIAEELNISKQKVYRFIKDNHIKEVHHEAHQKNDVKYYDDAAQTLIKSHFLNQEAHQETHHEAHQDHISDALINTLLKQLEEKDKQIESLSQALLNAQQLQAVAEQKIMLLETTQEVPEEKKRWRFFKK